jgi:hypothetical protein
MDYDSMDDYGRFPNKKRVKRSSLISIILNIIKKIKIK